jgi:hypothetical protein
LMGKGNIKSSRRVQYSKSCNGHKPVIKDSGIPQDTSGSKGLQELGWHQSGDER